MSIVAGKPDKNLEWTWRRSISTFTLYFKFPKCIFIYLNPKLWYLDKYEFKDANKRMYQFWFVVFWGF